MGKQSAGILLYRFDEDVIHFFLVHPGGPFWKNKDEGAWSIPKGEFEFEEDPLDAARREFMEETGIPLKAENYIELKKVKLKSGKTIYAWAASGHVNPDEISSNTFDIQLSSGKTQRFPEIDRGGWFTLEEAKLKLNPAQAPLLTDLLQKLT